MRGGLSARMTERNGGGDELLKDVVNADGDNGRASIREQAFEELEGNPGLGVERIGVILPKCKSAVWPSVRCRISRQPLGRNPRREGEEYRKQEDAHYASHSIST